VSTKVAGIWEDRALEVKPLEKIMVVGVFREDAIRKDLESFLVAALKDRGAKAFPSYKVFSMEKVADKDFLAAKIKEVQADGIVVVRATNQDAVGSYTPGEIYDTPPEYYPNLYDYLGRAHDDVVRVEYASPLDRRSRNMKKEKFTVETNVYSGVKENLIITIATETFTSYRTEKVVRNLAETIADNLEDHKLLGR